MEGVFWTAELLATPPDHGEDDDGSHSHSHSHSRSNAPNEPDALAVLEQRPPSRLDVTRFKIPRKLARRNPSAEPPEPKAITKLFEESRRRAAAAAATASAEADSALRTAHARGEAAHNAHEAEEEEFTRTTAQASGTVASNILASDIAHQKFEQAHRLEADLEEQRRRTSMQMLEIQFQRSVKDEEAEIKAKEAQAKAEAQEDEVLGLLEQQAKRHRASNIEKDIHRESLVGKFSQALGSAFADSRMAHTDEMDEEAAEAQQEAEMRLLLAGSMLKKRALAALDEVAKARRMHWALELARPLILSGRADRKLLRKPIDDLALLSSQHDFKEKNFTDAQVHLEKTKQEVRQLIGEAAPDDEVLNHKKTQRAVKNLAGKERGYKDHVKRTEAIEEKLAGLAAIPLQFHFRLNRAKREREAAIKKLLETAKDQCACWVQNIWRARLLRMEAEELRAEADRLEKESAALRIQAFYRAHNPKLRVEKMQQQQELLIMEAAAVRVQSLFRARRAKRRALELEASRQNLREEQSALKLQRVYRYRVSRKRVDALRRERDALLQEAAALKVQSAYRMRAARVKMKRAKEDHEKRFTDNLKNLVQQVGLLLRYKLKVTIRPLCVKVVSATGLAKATKGLTDPFVIVTIISGLGEQISFTECSPQKGTQDPQFDEEAILGKCDGYSRVVFTLCSGNGFGRRDEFLGQVSMPLGTLHYGMQTTRTISLPLGGYETQVLDSQHRPKKLGNLDFEGQGRLQVVFPAAPIAETMCGGMSRNVKTVLGRATRKKYWAVLMNRKLYMFEKHKQEKPKEVYDVQGAIPQFDEPTRTLEMRPAGHTQAMELLLENSAKVNAEWMYKLTFASGLESVEMATKAANEASGH